MGQAAVDLPDPLEAPVPPGAAGTDDLLSQLAGDEIDRLLAEADVEPTPLSPEADARPVVPPAAEAPAAEAAAAPALPPAADADLLPDVSPAADPSPPDGPAVAAQLDAAFDAQTGGAGDVPPAASPPAATPSDLVADVILETPAGDGGATGAAEVVESPASPPSDATPSEVAPPAAVEPAVSHAEREALAAPVPPDPDPDADWPEPPVEASPAAAPTPLYLRPLEWISAPLDARPAVRDAVGLVAIVSAVNAVAVLVYVLFFRRP